MIHTVSWVFASGWHPRLSVHLSYFERPHFSIYTLSLIRALWTTLLYKILNFRFDVVNCIGGFDVQSDRFPGQRLDEDLHATSEAKDKMQSALLLDIVIGECTAIFQLLPCEDQALLIRRNPFFVLTIKNTMPEGPASWENGPNQK